MAGNPYVGVGIQVSHIVVKVLDSVVVFVLLPQFLDQTSGVARISRCHAIAHLSPHVLPSLATAAAKEKIVIDLVVCGGLRSIEYSWRGALEADDDSAILSVGKYVAAEAIAFPSKVFGIVEAAFHLRHISTYS